MIENTFAFFGLIIFLLMAYGSFAKVRLYSLLGSLFLLVFGLFTLIDGVQLKTGETILTIGTTSIEDNATTYALNATTTYIYTSPPLISTFEWSNILSLILVLGGLSGMYIFALQD